MKCIGDGFALLAFHNLQPRSDFVLVLRGVKESAEVERLLEPCSFFLSKTRQRGEVLGSLKAPQPVVAVIA